MECYHERLRSADHRTRAERKDRDSLRLRAGVAVENENHLGNQIVLHGQHGTGRCPNLGAAGREITDLRRRTVGEHGQRAELEERKLDAELLGESCAPGRYHENIEPRRN